MNATQPTPLSMWPDNVSVGDTIVFTGLAWCGEEYETEHMVSCAVTVNEIVPSGNASGGFYATIVDEPQGRDVFVGFDEYAKRLGMVKRSRR